MATSGLATFLTFVGCRCSLEIQALYEFYVAIWACTIVLSYYCTIAFACIDQLKTNNWKS